MANTSSCFTSFFITQAACHLFVSHVGGTVEYIFSCLPTCHISKHAPLKMSSYFLCVGLVSRHPDQPAWMLVEDGKENHVYGCPGSSKFHRCIFVVFPPGQFWPAACGGGLHRGDGGEQVSYMSLSSNSITFSLSTLRTYLRKLHVGSAYSVCPFQFGVVGRAGGH